MPVQYLRTSNGVEHKIKWACGGCINGHRSKGCDHFSQWMIQVGLPGRPKAKCPHVEPPCTCKTKEKYLMVLIGINADGECVCQPYKAGQSREESTFMVPPLVEESPSHQGPQRESNFGQNQYDDIHNTDRVGVSESASGNNNGGPLMGYQHLAYGALPPQPYPLHAPPQSIASQANLPQACPQQCCPGNPAQGYLPHGRSQGSTQIVHSSWSSPSGYLTPPPAPIRYSGPTSTPLGQGHAHHFPDADSRFQPTPKQTSPGAAGSVHSHPHLSQGHQVLRRQNQSYPQGVPPHLNSDEPFHHGVLYANQEEEFVANGHSLQHTFPDHNLNTPIDTVLDPHLNNGQQQEQHVPASEFPSVEPSDPFAPAYDFLNLPEPDFDPTLANIQYDQHQTEKHQATGRSYGKCQCGPACNCVRCTTHPMNSATVEWVQKMYDTMDEDLDGDFDGDFDGGSALTSRPQSSYGPRFPAPVESGHNLEPQAQNFDSEVPQVLPMDFNGYSVLNFPINGCSSNADCRCGENCRCEGCLTHSGHVKLLASAMDTTLHHCVLMQASNITT